MNPVVTNPKLLISFLHQTTTLWLMLRYIMRLLLISFLHQTTTAGWRSLRPSYCFLSHFYIKPQLSQFPYPFTDDCFLSHFYIKPQPERRFPLLSAIASYLISTSNHNLPKRYHRCSGLLLISFLHQTTTRCWCSSARPYCFLSHFYIKPQPTRYIPVIEHIASYLISTSNHNRF